MYYYWSRKGIRPSEFYNMRLGELIVVRAFYEEEIREKERRAKAGTYCPYLW